MTDKPLLLLFMNRAAGRAKGHGWLESVRAVLEPRFRLESVCVSIPTEAGESLHAGLERGASLVAVAGGDGTVHRVVNLLHGRAVPLGLLPLGTANDLARELGVPLDPAEAARLLLRGRRSHIDLIEVAGRRFCTVGGLGLPAESARLHGQVRGLHPLLDRALGALGPAVYPFSAAARILGWPAQALHVRVGYQAPGQTEPRLLETESRGLFVANQGSVGGALRFCPRSENRDGVFEICLLPASTRAALLGTLGKMRLGLPLGRDELTVLEAQSATLQLDRPCRFFADGELLGCGLEFSISIHAGALEVMA
jgi:diacylglycerol kinase family enzyme